MKQEEKQLLLKDLCARIPYRPIITLYGDERDKCLLCGVDGEELYLNIDSDPFSLRDFNIKPYLRPMSSMTEEEKIELCIISYVPDEMRTLDEKLYVIQTNANNSIDWLNAHHFDYRGLIEKGLAFEAPDDMYKVE